MKRTAILAAVAVALSACTSIDTGSIDTAIKTNLPKTCALLQTGHAAFVAASASGTIKASTIAKEQAAYAGVETICADPSKVTAANALVLVATAYATISIALKEARATQ
jgi:hypothetical protein